LPKKVLADVDDIEQIRAALQDLVDLAVSMKWCKEEIAAWLHVHADLLMEHSE
jgi:hypothetical protein